MVYRSYPLSHPLTINGREFTEVIISSHYETSHGSYMSDEKIKVLINQLDEKFFSPRLEGNLPQNNLVK